MEIKKEQRQKREKQKKQKKATSSMPQDSMASCVKNQIRVASVSAARSPVSEQGFPAKPAAILETGSVADPTSDQKLHLTEENVSQPDQDQYLYVYGIIDNTGITDTTDITLDLKGLRDASITSINFKDLGILFSFYPALHPLIEEKEALLHAEILNKIAEKATLIPMAFGTVFKDREILETVLVKSYPAIKKTLELLQDKMELGIKVVKKSLEEKGFEEELSIAVHQEILEELSKLSVKSVAGDKFSERLLLNNSFLVEKNKFAQFSDKVGELEEKHQNVKFLYSGPWPAYSFVDINIKVG